MLNNKETSVTMARGSGTAHDSVYRPKLGIQNESRKYDWTAVFHQKQIAVMAMILAGCQVYNIDIYPGLFDAVERVYHIDNQNSYVYSTNAKI